MKRLGCKWSPDVRQIDLDVNRTYRDHTMFRKRYDEKQQQLFHVLGKTGIGEAWEGLIHRGRLRTIAVPYLEKLALKSQVFIVLMGRERNI